MPGSCGRSFGESDALLALELPAALLERVSRHLTFDQLLDLARQFGPDETETAAAFDPEAAPPALDFSVALDDDGGRSKEKTRENQRHLRRWQAEFASDAAFLQLPEYKKRQRQFPRGGRCRAGALRALAQRGGGLPGGGKLRAPIVTTGSTRG